MGGEVSVGSERVSIRKNENGEHPESPDSLLYFYPVSGEFGL